MITEAKKLETVSIVIPVYNEEKYIEGLIDSLLKQDYDKEKTEIIFVDGESSDKTVEIINRKMSEEKINYKVMTNPKRIPPSSVNVGIKNAKNDIIVRLDAHSEYPSNYISKCVYNLNNMDADNVGCICKPGSKTKIGKAIANVVSSKFGVGNSSFRTGAESGYVDTVPFGTFRRELFDKIGYFNEELPRSEDNEFNYRIRKNGGKVYLFNDTEITYYPRDTIYKLMKMGFQNGKWATYTGYIIPGTMGIRHFIPLLFVLGLIVGTIITALHLKALTIAFFSVLSLYFIIDLLFTLKSVITDGIEQLICFIIYPLFHISYGIGSIFGIFKILKKVIKK